MSKKRPPAKRRHALDLAAGVRRYLAQNHPRLWLLRAHLLILAMPAVGLACLIAAYAMPVSPRSVPDIVRWHTVLFVIASLAAIYWLVNYVFVIETVQLPPKISEPPVIVVMTCMILFVVPTFIFPLVAGPRIQATFPDHVGETRNVTFIGTLYSMAGDRDSPLQQTFPAPAPDEKFVNTNQFPSRSVEFKRLLVCGLGEAMLREIVATGAIRLGPSKTSEWLGNMVHTGTVELEDEGPNEIPSQYRAVHDVMKAFSGQIRYEFTTPGTKLPDPDVAQEDYDIRFFVGCRDISEDFAGKIVAKARTALGELLEVYFTPLSRADREEVIRVIFEPACEWMDVAKECLERASLRDRILNTAGLGGMSANLAGVDIAYGKTIEFVTSRTIRSSDMTGGSVTLPAPEAQAFTDRETPFTNGGYLVAVVVITGWCSIVAKSIRLTKERASELALSAVVFVPGVLIAVLLGSSLLYSVKEFIASRMGFEFEGPDISIYAIFTTFSITTLFYCIIPVVTKRKFFLALYLSQFNLFYLIVITLFILIPIDRYIDLIFGDGLSDNRKYLLYFLAYVFWFAVVYEVYYSIAARLTRRAGR